MAIVTTGIIGANKMFGQGGAKFADNLPGKPKQLNPVKFQNFDTPRFIVTVDTEEEFDWSSPFQRTGFGTGHVRHIGRFQSMCDQHGVKPIYLLDYPIVSDPVAIEIFNEMLTKGICEIGAQLHSWVTPPFDEDVNIKNSYASNLPNALERKKIEALYHKIVESFSVKTAIYRAGRYGAGPHTLSVLKELGVKIDTSVRSLFDYSRQQGPNYSDSSLIPYWLSQGDLLELPLTSIFAGMARVGGPQLFFNVFESEASRAFLARTGMLERIALTPEGIPLDRAIKAIDIAINQGLPVLNFSFHSPSLQPGHTPYVRSDTDLEIFYNWWRGVFAYLRARGIQPTTAGELIEAAF
jgi:hypothetical protein